MLVFVCYVSFGVYDGGWGDGDDDDGPDNDHDDHSNGDGAAHDSNAGASMPAAYEENRHPNSSSGPNESQVSPASPCSALACMLVPIRSLKASDKHAVLAKRWEMDCRRRCMPRSQQSHGAHADGPPAATSACGRSSSRAKAWQVRPNHAHLKAGASQPFHGRQRHEIDLRLGVSESSQLFPDV